MKLLFTLSLSMMFFVSINIIENFVFFFFIAKTRFDLEDVELCDQDGIVIDKGAFSFFANSVIYIKRPQKFNYIG